MIIFGTRTMNSVRKTGVFNCPRCGASQSYVHNDVKRWFTLYFIPVIPMGRAGSYIQCRRCAGTYTEAVLSYDPQADIRDINLKLRGVLVLVMLANAHGANPDEVRAICDYYHEATNTPLAEKDVYSNAQLALGQKMQLADFARQAAPKLTFRGKAMFVRGAIGCCRPNRNCARRRGRAGRAGRLIPDFLPAGARHRGTAVVRGLSRFSCQRKWDCPPCATRDVVRTSPMQFAVILLGLVLHAAILLPPALLCGHAADPAVWCFLLLASAFYLGDATAARATAPPAETLSGGGRAAGALALTTGLTLLALFWIALGSCGQDAGAAAGGLRWAGGAAIVAGAVLRRAAIGRLGPFFLSQPRVLPGQPLVTDGVYRLLRHPLETGLLAAGLGACLFFASLPALAVWAAGLLPLVLIRLRLEDRVLLAGFGERYRQYARRTGALLPFPRRSCGD